MVSNIDEAKNLACTLDRREHTTAMMLQTNPPAPEPIINVEGETPIQAREFAMDTAAMPKEGFNGA